MELRGDLQRRIKETAKNIKREIVYKLDPESKARVLMMNDVRNQLIRLNIRSLPNFLEVDTQQEQFVSTRRLEASQIRVEEINNSPIKDPIFTITSYSIADKYTDDGQLGVLFTPSIISAEPSSLDLDKQLKEYEDYEMHLRYISPLQAALYFGHNFKLNEWRLGNPTVTLVTKVKSKFITIGGGSHGGSYYDKLGEFVELPAVIEPIDGFLELSNTSRFCSGDEVKVQRELNEKFMRFYVLTPGSSEKRKSGENMRIAEPRLAPIIAD